MQEQYDEKVIKKLHKWLKGQKITTTDFAKSLGTSYRIAWSWLTGRSKPSLKYGVKIEKLTKGLVKCSEWANFDTQKKESRKKVAKKHM